MRWASSMAASVSAVSPDCDREITSVLESITGSRYRNSEEFSTSVGTRTSDSIQLRPTMAAWKLVPMPTKTTRSMLWTSSLE